MAGPNTAPQVPTIAVGETRLFSVSFDDKLDSGVTMTGTPTVAEVTTTDLTISNKAVNTAALTINGETTAIGRAVQFLVAGQLTTHSPYTISITASTSSTPAETVKGYVTFAVDTR